jgi:hypothetical protein
MKSFALLNQNNLVINISVADDNWDSTGWLEYTNKNCGIGYTFDAVNDVFIAPQPLASWSLDQNFDWQPPTPMPTEGEWDWDEDSLSWLEQSL